MRHARKRALIQIWGLRFARARASSGGLLVPEIVQSAAIQTVSIPLKYFRSATVAATLAHGNTTQHAP